jgi:phosphonate transport system substrate-binding protein
LDLKRKIKDAFLNMHKTEKGRAILNAMMIDGFVEIHDSAYNSIREMEKSIKNEMISTKKINGKKKIFFGIIPRDNPRILYEKYQPLLDYLSEVTPYYYELGIKKNYEETVEAVGRGEFEVAILGPLTYLEARAKYGAICILKPKGIKDNASYRSVIIKRKDSNIKSINELRGKSMAFSASKSTSGNLMPRYMLANSGIHLNELSGYANFDYHDSVVKAVIKGQYDAGAVRDSIAKKYEKLGIEIIAESSDIPTGPLVASPGTSFAVIENIKKALLSLNYKNPDHQKILKRLDDDFRNGFIDASDNDYAGIRAKINAVPQTCGKGCHPKIRL